MDLVVPSGAKESDGEVLHALQCNEPAAMNDANVRTDALRSSRTTAMPSNPIPEHDGFPGHLAQPKVRSSFLVAGSNLIQMTQPLGFEANAALTGTRLVLAPS